MAYKDNKKYQTSDGDGSAVIRIFVQTFAFGFDTVVADVACSNPRLTSYRKSVRAVAEIGRTSNGFQLVVGIVLKHFSTWTTTAVSGCRPVRHFTFNAKPTFALQLGSMLLLQSKK